MLDTISVPCNQFSCIHKQEILPPRSNPGRGGQKTTYRRVRSDQVRHTENPHQRPLHNPIFPPRLRSLVSPVSPQTVSGPRRLLYSGQLRSTRKITPPAKKKNKSITAHHTLGCDLHRCRFLCKTWSFCTWTLTITLLHPMQKQKQKEKTQYMLG